MVFRLLNNPLNNGKESCMHTEKINANLKREKHLGGEGGELGF